MAYRPIEDYGIIGNMRTAALVGSDPVGRLTWTLQGALGDADAWRGGTEYTGKVRGKWIQGGRWTATKK